MNYFYEVKELIDSSKYRNKMGYSSIRQYKENHVFDENKSVLWNKQQVEIENKKQKDLRDDYNAEENRLINLFQDDLCGVIISQLKVNREKADLIFNKAWDDEHSGGLSEVVDYAEEAFKQAKINANQKYASEAMRDYKNATNDRKRQFALSRYNMAQCNLKAFTGDFGALQTVYGLWKKYIIIFIKIVMINVI